MQVRTPYGRISRAGESEYAPAQIKRAADAAMQGLRDPEWGTPLGQLFLNKKITAPMYAAGKWWRDIAELYRQAIDAPMGSPKPMVYEVGIKGSRPDPDSERGKCQAAFDGAAVKAFEEAHAVLLGAGVLSEKAVRDLCEHDERPFGVLAMEAASSGLLWLSQWRELTNHKNPGDK